MVPMDGETIVAEKTRVRALVKMRRKGIAASARERAEAAVARRVLELPELRGVRRLGTKDVSDPRSRRTETSPRDTPAVGVYAALPSELSLAPLIQQLYAIGARVAYPCVRSGRRMDFYRIEQDERWGFIDHPARLCRDEDDSPGLEGRLVEPWGIDLMLVPAVAFDRQCLRLGFGGGFYDTYLPRLDDTRCVVVGVAFDEQIVEKLPREEFDRGVPRVITPTRVLLAQEGPQR